MTKCLSCENWMPKSAPKGMAALGFAPCKVNSYSMGHTFSLRTTCEQHKPAPDETTLARVDYLRRKGIDGQTNQASRTS